MPGLKRSREDTGGKEKRPRSSAPSKPTSTKPAAAPSAPAAAPETDFPRGGGSGLTPLEHAQALREGRAERAAAGGDLFTDGAKVKSKSGKAKEGAVPQDKAAKQKAWRENKNAKKKKNDGIVEEAPKEAGAEEYARVEHLNYKRLAPGSRLLCSVLAVHPLALVVSLPNQLLGHVPLTSISPHLNTRLEAVAGDQSDSDEEEEESDGDDDAVPSKGAPELRQLYSEGDWVRASVVAVRHAGARSLGREGQEYLRDAGRVELSLAPSTVNEGLSPADVTVGTVLPVALRSREDHGWVLDSGVQELAGFATFADVPANATVGAVLPALVTEHADGARSFKATLNAEAVRKASLGPTQAPSLSGLIPGTQVNALITNVAPGGLSAKLWGLFDASIDATHLPLAEGKGVEDSFKVGQKLRARLLWDLGPQATGGLADDDGKQGGRKLALSAASHVMGFLPPPGLAAFPIGTQKQVRILRVDADWGLACEVEDAGASAPSGFVHISNIADEHITALSPVAGPWREGTTHAARVIGHAPTDGRLLLSLQPSILAKSFMRVSDVTVGAIVKGTVARIGPDGNAIFIDLGGTVHGVVFPIHFADVPLRRPEKKYKPGSAVRARVLHIDPLRNRITCTLKKSLINSDLPMIASLQDARTGVVTHATVSRFLEPASGGAPTALLVDFFGGLRALVPAAEAAPDGAPASAPTALRSAYFEGKVVRVRLTHVDYDTSRITASIRQASPSYLARLDVDAVALGERVEARLAAVHADVVVLELVPSHARALISLKALAEERSKTVEEVRAELAEGEIISNLVVVDKNKDKGLVILGNSKAKPRAKPGHQSISAGAVVAARVVERSREPNVAMLLLDGGVRARLHATDCTDEFSEDPLPALDSKIDVALLSVNGTTKKRAVASLRASVLAAARGEEDVAKPRDSIISSAADVKVGQKYRGYVKSIVDSGLFVDLGRNVTARVKIAELFDNFVKAWKPHFKIGQLVEGTVTELDASNSKVELSLKTEPGSKGKRGAGAKAAAAEESDKPVRARLSDYKKGQKVKGFVRAITDFGVFVQVEGTEISGLAHKKELSDNKSADAIKAFSVGDRVRAVVLEVQLEKKRIAFGLKPSYFDAEDFEDSDDEAGEPEEDATMDQLEASDDDDDEEEEDSDGEPHDSDVEMDGEDFLKRLAADDSDEDMLQVVRNSEAEDSDEEEDSEDDEEDSDEEEESDDNKMDEDEPAPAPVAAPAKPKAKQADGPIAPALELAGGFSWSAPEKSAVEVDEDDSEASSDDEDDAEETAKARNKRRKGKNQAVQEDVTADLATKAPESAADFERLLLGSPHSSYLWIQFMSFQLQLSDVERAREVARRALKVISFREEQERLNVWIALLNLENVYGSEETREAVFRQASQAMDAKTVHMRMLAILEKSDKLEAAEELWRKTAKKFGGSSKVWVGWVQFYLRHDRQDDARKLIPRSMQALEKRKHVKTVLAIALSEYKIGDAERGRTIFEGLVDSHPKRLDIWLVYIAQEAKSDGNAAVVRDLYERVLALKLSSKKAKSTLKAWLRYEQERGDAAGEQLVLQKAKEWAEKHAPRDEEDEEEEEYT